MSNRAWMPLHITDYLADTGHLNAAEHGAYLMLIMHYWQNGTLPADERLLARLARMTKDEWAESRDVLAMLFGPNWTHKRIDAELVKADEIIEKRRAAANGRHQKSKDDASAVHVQSKSTDTGALPRTLDQGLAKEEPNGSSKKRGSRLPANFVPDIGFAISIGLSQSQAQNEAVKFCEWWPAQAGQKGVKLDWGLTWQTWCRKALERLPQSRGSPAFRQERTDHFANQARELNDGQDRSSRSDSGNWDDAQSVSVLAIGYHRG
jgi:uncharacterized protein YdaU (DUF1376 family)